jgi:MFS family permease
MIVAILAYSVLTGLSAIAWNWVSFAVLRFLVGIAIGSEWATGTSMTAEVWPDHARGKGAGLMQCGLGIGFFVASFVWLFVSPLGPDAWRYMYLFGILPALLTLWIRRGISESMLWTRTDERRRAAVERKRSGATLAAEEETLARFTFSDLFAHPEIRRRTFIVFLMSMTTTLAWWGISSWVPPYVASIAANAAQPAQQWASYAAMAYNAGAILGYVSLGFLADRFGRKPIAFLFFAMALVLTPVLFMWTQDLRLLLVAAAVNAFFSLGQFSWMPVWLPELFPTRMRATAIAFAFNAPRFVAVLGPLLAGQLIMYFGGYSYAATIVSSIYVLGMIVVWLLPETRGRPLPEKV